MPYQGLTVAIGGAPDTVRVPREPTRDMVNAGVRSRNPQLRLDLLGSNEAHRLRRQVARMWTAMLHAAPMDPT